MVVLFPRRIGVSLDLDVGAVRLGLGASCELIDLATADSGTVAVPELEVALVFASAPLRRRRLGAFPPPPFVSAASASSWRCRRAGLRGRLGISRLRGRMGELVDLGIFASLAFVRSCVSSSDSRPTRPCRSTHRPDHARTSSSRKRSTRQRERKHRNHEISASS